MPKLRKHVVVAYSRVFSDGGVICRQVADTDEAKTKGGGFIYFTDRRRISPVAGRFLVEEEIAKPLSDGLFEGSSQSFRLVRQSEFDRFKAQYESM